jgi:flagella basal body P-ring formation protein FlgA
MRIDLKDDISVRNPIVTVADVASVYANDKHAVQTLNALRVCNAPMTGHIEQVTREEIEQILRTRTNSGPIQITWRGAHAVRVRRVSQTIGADALIEAAIKYLRGAMAARFDKVDIEPAAPIADLDVPTGVVSLRARPIEGKQTVVRVPVWVDIYVDGIVIRSAVVPVRIKGEKRVLVARRDLAAGMSVKGSDFEIVQQDIAGLSGSPVETGSMSEPARLRKPLAAGKVLTTAHLLQRDAVSRGDVVTLVFAEGGVVVETLATVEHDASVGTAVTVRPAGGSDRVEGRLIARGMVEANGTK